MFILLGSNFVLLTFSSFQERTVYKIQVASFLSEYPAEDIQRDLELEQPLTIHFINGRYKYCVGAYDTFEAAAADLNSIPVGGAYVIQVSAAAGQAPQETSTQTTQPTPEEQPTGQQQETETREFTVYVVQVAASRVFIQPDNVKSRVGVSDEVNYFTRDGWYKYYVGRFDTEEAATARLNELAVNGFVSSFVETREVPVGSAGRPTQDISTDTTGQQQESAVADTVSGQPGYGLRDSDIRELYSVKIHEADSAYDAGAMLVARKLYREALVLSPEMEWPKLRIREIDAQLKEEKSRPLFNRIPLLTVIILIIIVMMIIVLIITLIYRTRRKRITKRDQAASQQYQDAVTEYLFDEKAEQPATLRQADSPQKKQVLIDEIMQLYANLSGEIANRLRELYIDLGLDNESVQKTKSPQWHIRAKGFRELAQMNIKTVNDEIERCLNSPNDVLRMEAQLALVRLNYDDPFSFLDKLEKPFTSWEQLHVFEMMKRYQIETPDFTRWINSSNLTVVLFSIRMIRAFKQVGAYERLLPFLTHADNELREEVILTLGDLQNPDVLPVLKERYINESEQNKVLILKSMAKLPDESNIYIN